MHIAGRKLIVGMCVMAGAFGGSVVVDAIAFGAPGQSHRSNTVSHVRPSGRHVSRTLLAHFAALRRGTAAQGRLAHVAGSVPAITPGIQALVGNLASNVNGESSWLGLDMSSIQEDATSAGQAVWTIGGTGGACVITTTSPRDPSNPMTAIPYSVCGPTAQVMQHGIIGIGREPDGSHIIYGIVPNGNASITVGEPGGGVATVATPNGAVAQVVSYMPDSITLTNASGASTTATP